MPTNVPTELVTLRLVDMARVHPAQDNTRVCSRCGQQVGIYPSGQAILRDNPDVKVSCVQCAMSARGTIESLAAAPWPVIVQESRDSEDVGKA
jgi:hypothetical protein